MKAIKERVDSTPGYYFLAAADWEIILAADKDTQKEIREYIKAHNKPHKKQKPLAVYPARSQYH